MKRALFNPSKWNSGGNCNEKEDDEGDDGSQGRVQQDNGPRNLADKIIKLLVESIDEGGHGAISPLTMTISIGSEYVGTGH